VLIRLIRSLSLDIVAGGVAGAAFAAHVSGARMPAAFWHVLPAAIWAVYTLDHLIDGRRVGPNAANDRHAFHARHVLPLSLAVALAGGYAALRAFTLPRPLIAAGVALAAAVVLYLGAMRTRFPSWLPREALVAAIYVAGIWIGPLALAADRGPWVWAALALHAAVALGYLLAYAWFEAAMDSADDSPSLARAWGRPRLARLIAGVSAVTLLAALAAACMPGFGPRAAFATLAAVAAVPWLMLRGARTLERFDGYRNAEWTLLALLVPVLFADAG
jgi:hypothetical protein